MCIKFTLNMFSIGVDSKLDTVPKICCGSGYFYSKIFLICSKIHILFMLFVLNIQVIAHFQTCNKMCTFSFLKYLQLLINYFSS